MYSLVLLQQHRLFASTRQCNVNMPLECESSNTASVSQNNNTSTTTETHQCNVNTLLECQSINTTSTCHATLTI